MTERLSIDSQIAEMEYVVEEMRKWHNHQINARKIRDDVAMLHNRHAMEILATLRWFKREEAFIREMFKQRKEANDAESGQGVDRGDAGSETT